MEKEGKEMEECYGLARRFIHPVEITFTSTMEQESCITEADTLVVEPDESKDFIGIDNKDLPDRVLEAMNRYSCTGLSIDMGEENEVLNDIMLSSLLNMDWPLSFLSISLSIITSEIRQQILDIVIKYSNRLTGFRVTGWLDLSEIKNLDIVLQARQSIEESSPLRCIDVPKELFPLSRIFPVIRFWSSIPDNFFDRDLSCVTSIDFLWNSAHWLDYPKKLNASDLRDIHVTINQFELKQVEKHIKEDNLKVVYHISNSNSDVSGTILRLNHPKVRSLGFFGSAYKSFLDAMCENQYITLLEIAHCNEPNIFDSISGMKSLRPLILKLNFIPIDQIVDGLLRLISSESGIRFLEINLRDSYLHKFQVTTISQEKEQEFIEALQKNKILERLNIVGTSYLSDHLKECIIQICKRNSQSTSEKVVMLLLYWSSSFSKDLDVRFSMSKII